MSYNNILRSNVTHANLVHSPYHIIPETLHHTVVIYTTCYIRRSKYSSTYSIQLLLLLCVYCCIIRSMYEYMVRAASGSMPLPGSHPIPKRLREKVGQIACFSAAAVLRTTLNPASLRSNPTSQQQCSYTHPLAGGAKRGAGTTHTQHTAVHESRS